VYLGFVVSLIKNSTPSFGKTLILSAGFISLILGIHLKFFTVNLHVLYVTALSTAI